MYSLCDMKDTIMAQISKTIKSDRASLIRIQKNNHRRNWDVFAVLCQCRSCSLLYYLASEDMCGFTGPGRSRRPFLGLAGESFCCFLEVLESGEVNLSLLSCILMTIIQGCNSVVHKG